MTMNELIMKAREKKCSDIHISEGMPVSFRIHGQLLDSGFSFPAAETREMILSMLSDEQREQLENGNDVDFAIETPDYCRQRVNVFRQMKKVAATIRLLNNTIPTLEQLQMPKVLQNLADQPRGLILVTGPTGSGKSTTLSAMIDYINKNRSEHIITIEDPVEYVYESGMSVIHQREIGVDTKSFAASLRSALREDPDVILVGEMRDYETISAAVTAAETGHLVMSTLHTTGAAQTLDRIIDSCPPHAQNQIRTQLSTILKGVITQALIPLAMGGGRVAATEILVGTDAVGSLIRDNKCFQLATVMQSGAALGMHTLNADLARLVRAGTIRREDAIRVSNNKNEILDLNSETPMFINQIGNSYVTMLKAGYPINVFYGYVTDGLFQNWGEVNRHATQPGAAPGDIRFRDLNNDGVINDEDRTILGNPNPNWFFSLSNNLSYKGWELSVFLQGVAGNKIYNANNVDNEGMAAAYNQTTAVLNRWTGEGTSYSMPRAIWGDPNQNCRVSDRFVENGSYLRLKNITLSYTLPKKWLQKIQLENARISFSCENVATITGYSGFDPEVDVNGIDSSRYPISRTFSMGLNFNF